MRLRSSLKIALLFDGILKPLAFRETSLSLLLKTAVKVHSHIPASSWPGDRKGWEGEKVGVSKRGKRMWMMMIWVG